MNERTLLRALTEATGLSRRKAFEAIRSGRVTEAGVIVTDPSKPHGGGPLTLDAQPIGEGGRREHVYLLMHKPAGVVSTTEDELGRTTVLDVLPARWRVPGLHPVGRLDQDTTGLLLLTTDGSLTFRLTHPRHQVEKEYHVATLEPLSQSQVARLRRGVWLGGRLRKPASVTLLPSSERPYSLSIVLREGRKHQVKQMVGAVGGKVTRLRRVREGPLMLGGLREGAVRPLTADEVATLLAGHELTPLKPGLRMARTGGDDD